MSTARKTSEQELCRFCNHQFFKRGLTTHEKACGRLVICFFTMTSIVYKVLRYFLRAHTNYAIYYYI